MDRTEALVAQIARTIPKIIGSSQSPLVVGEEGESYTLTQTFVIAALGESGAMSMTDLASKLKVSPPTMTGVVDRLEKRGIVKREHSIVDRRSVMVALDEKGEAAFGAIIVAMVAKWRSLAFLLNDEEQAHLISILRKFEEAL